MCIILGGGGFRVSGNAKCLMGVQTISFGIAEPLSKLGLWGREAYPERSGVLDCVYYMRTGSCGYGAKCRYNHPRDRGSVSP